jgi:hypothetical protein
VTNFFTATSRLAAAGTAASLGLLVTSTPARADDTGFYVGANVGRVLSTYHRADIDSAVTRDFGAANTNFAMGPSSVRKDHAMWSVDVGYMLSQNFGIEASYLYLGSLRYSGFGSEPAAAGGTSQVMANIEFKSHGPALAVLGVLPMNNIWEVDARLGAYEGKSVATYYTAVDAFTTAGRLSKSSTSLLAGLGTAVTITSHCVARLDYMRIQHLDEEVLRGSFNVDLLTVGLAFVF